MIHLLQFYSIEPILVFDGKSLPSKEQTLKVRLKNKNENL